MVSEYGRMCNYSHGICGNLYINRALSVSLSENGTHSVLFLLILPAAGASGAVVKEGRLLIRAEPKKMSVSVGLFFRNKGGFSLLSVQKYIFA